MSGNDSNEQRDYSEISFEGNEFVKVGGLRIRMAGRNKVLFKEQIGGTEIELVTHRGEPISIKFDSTSKGVGWLFQVYDPVTSKYGNEYLIRQGDFNRIVAWVESL